MRREFLPLAAALALAACASSEEPKPAPAPPVVAEAPPPIATAPTIAPAPLPSSGPVFAPDPEPAFPQSAAYQRVREYVGGVQVLEIATRKFVSADGKGPTIQLVGAVHVAEAAFYEALQRRLDEVEVVLYEGVRPAGTRPLPADAPPEARARATRDRFEFLRTLARKDRESTGAFPGDLDALVAGAERRWNSELRVAFDDGWGRPIRYVRRPAGDAAPESFRLSSDGPDGVAAEGGSDGASDDLHLEVRADDPLSATENWALYTKFAAALGLVYQGAVMNASKPSWRSSDMSIDELKELASRTGADLSALLSLLDGSSAMGRFANAILDQMAKSPKMAAFVRYSIVISEKNSASTADHATEPLLGEGFVKDPALLADLVLHARNAVVLKDLRELMAKEPGVRSVAIFYGAAHMPDFERRLAKELGYYPADTDWFAAMRADPKDAGFTPPKK